MTKPIELNEDEQKTESLRIGEAARAAGVSERTLRYYEELDLLSPADRSPGANRRYGTAELERVRRIRELREVMGLNLAEISLILGAEDKIDALRAAWYRSADPGERRAILDAGLRTHLELRERVARQLDRAAGALAEIDQRVARIHQLRKDLDESELSPV